jgi:hypothetical protein
MECFLAFEGGTVLEWEVKVIQRDLLECAADPLTSPCWWTKKAGPVPLQGSPFSTVRAYSTFKSHQTRTIYGVQIRSPAPAYPPAHTPFYRCHIDRYRGSHLHDFR